MNSKQNLYFSLTNADRLGHLSTELFYIRNIYPAEQYNYNIFVPKLSTLGRMNTFMFNKVTEGMNIIETDDENVIMAAYKSGPEVTTEIRGNDLYVLLDGNQIYNTFLNHIKDSGPNFYYQLTQEELLEGLKLRREFGIPDNAPIVTLHVRDRGFLPHLNYHSFRDANIENYIPAIEYLLSLGIYVVRIGDPSMKKIQGLPPNFIDAIHHPSYNHIVEPYFVSTSLFHFGTISGPCSVALVFNKPILYTNVQLSVAEWGHDKDLVIPKKFYSYKTHRFLTYQEILNSPMVEFWETKQFEENDITLIENSPRELLLAANEMVLRQMNKYGNEDQISKINNLIKKEQKQLHKFRGDSKAVPPLYAGYYSKKQFAHTFCALNPWFLGHDF